MAKQVVTLDDLSNLGFQQSIDGTYSRQPILVPENLLPKVYIGLDLGVETGLAVWFPKDKKLNCYTISFIEYLQYFYNTILAQKIKFNVILVVEDVISNSPVFKAKKVYIETKGVHDNKLAAVCKLASNIGSVKEKTDIAIKLAEKHNIPVIRKRPQKGCLTKLTADQFRRITGYTAHTTSHSRDAGILIWNIH